MTWFGWLLIGVYMVAMIATVAMKARRNDAQGAVTNVITTVIIVAGILIFGTGRGL